MHSWLNKGKQNKRKVGETEKKRLTLPVKQPPKIWWLSSTNFQHRRYR